MRERTKSYSLDPTIVVSKLILANSAESGKGTSFSFCVCVVELHE